MNFKLSDLSENHIDILVEALDLYSRIGMGQFHQAPFIYGCYEYDKTEHITDELKKAVGLRPSSFKSIGSKKLDDKFRIAWDMHQVLRHKISWQRNPEGNPMNVNYDKPFKWSKEPLIKADVV